MHASFNIQTIKWINYLLPQDTSENCDEEIYVFGTELPEVYKKCVNNSTYFASLFRILWYKLITIHKQSYILIKLKVVIKLYYTIYSKYKSWITQSPENRRRPLNILITWRQAPLPWWRATAGGGRPVWGARRRTAAPRGPQLPPTPPSGDLRGG